jgi:hypothetical protein
MRQRIVIGLTGLVCAGAVALLLGGALASPSKVSAFPSPGSRVVPPGAQIAFRDVPAGDLGEVGVTGSRSGPHSGAVRAHSDG